MQKKIDDQGCVAVLVSHGYGAGWYTWHREEALLYDPQIVDLVLAEAPQDEIMALCRLKYSDELYFGGVGGLRVHWVPEGERFRIDEYDGLEHLVLERNESWLTA
jgi:hypothetical protein